MNSEGLRFLDGRLVIRRVARIGKVELAPFKSGADRLVLFVETEVVSGDPMLHYIFESTLRGNGCLALVNTGDLPSFVEGIASGCDSAARSLKNPDLNVTVVVVEPAPALLPLVAAAVLNAAGVEFQTAINEVEKLLPDVLFDTDFEIALSEARRHLDAYRSYWSKKRAEVAS